MHSGEEKKRNKGKHQRTRQGVPFAVTALLVILALICGGVAGYFGGTRFSDLPKKLADAEARLEEYDLMIAQMYTDDYATGVEEEEAWIAENNGSAALTGTNVIQTEAAEVYVVVEYSGGEILSDEAMPVYEKALSDRAMAGEDVSLIKDEVVDQVLADMADERVAHMKAFELGLTQYDEADNREIDARAQAQYDGTVAFYAGANADEDDIAAAQKYLEDTEGYTLESVRAEIAASYWKEKLYAHVIEGVNVDADTIAAYYAQLVDQQKAEYDADTNAFEADMASGEIIVYHPAGYRTVKQIYFALDDASMQRAAEINAQLETETDETVRGELKAELDALYAPLEEKAAAVIGELDGGADFDALVKKYSDEDILGADAFSSTGYYICENTTMWPAEFVSAGMALAAPGDVSAAVRSERGVHIVRYIANVEAGSVPLSNVSSRLTTATQEHEKEVAWEEQMQLWREEAEVVFYPENMK